MRRPKLLLAILVSIVANLTTMPVISQETSVDPWLELEEEIRGRGLDPAEMNIPGRLNDEMRAWVRERFSPNASSAEILRQILAELVDPAGLKLLYNPNFTGTAEEVWESGQANCLGFTHLYVGLTRELGLPTYYVRWSMVERYRREGDLVVVSGHVSAGLGPGNQRQVLEFGAVDGMEGFLAQPISDLNAMARHYANRSAEFLRAGDVTAAVEAADLATRLEPTLADAWVNLGVSRRRSGDPVGAEDAYREATRIDPDHLPAYQNLSALLYLQGADDAARKTLALLDRRDNRNPFTYLSLGDASLDSHRFEEAARFYSRAHRLSPKTAETNAARGIVALAMGDETKAKKWLRRAQKIDPLESRTVELANKVSRIEDSSK